MAARKKSLIHVFFFSIMIIISLVSGFGEGIKQINYKDLIKDTIPGCTSKNPKECVKVPANTYHRGCEISTRCHREQHSSSG
ncbi:Protein RALF-like 7 [Arabidopsis thaliana]|uniref:Uncharacterized protein n=2 Tax=Arabidopsis TaxID=3701 RepID=A0A5S9WND8_ARATH|nr:Rapid ALkalinization Factor [Arabidopsis thaliana x Arabidopsis arenosa]CAA0305470.1 unnamed protein product [Arabidopsis thaliana]